MIDSICKMTPKIGTLAAKTGFRAITRRVRKFFSRALENGESAAFSLDSGMLRPEAPPYCAAERLIVIYPDVGFN